MITYPWLEQAKKLEGIHEATKAGSEAVDQLWRDFKMSGNVGKSTSLPWCSALIGGCMERSGISTRLPEGTKNPISKDSSQYWTQWGTKLDKPVVGAIVVFRWSPNAGHVGFVVGKTANGLLLVLGGNQSDSVCVKAFETDRIVGYYFPRNQEIKSYDLPIGTAAEMSASQTR